MAIVKTEALVIRRYDLRETSLLVNFYTLNFGKITGEMKGIRTEPEKFASSVELFSHNDIIFYQKRNSSVHLVSACDLKENFSRIRQSIALITSASVVAELLDAVMPAEDKNENIFHLAVATLNELATTSNPDKILMVFKIKLLALSGFKPHLDSCVSCQAPVNASPKFSISLGGLVCPKCNSKDQSARSIFRGTVATIVHIEKNDFKNNLTLGMNPQIKRELDLVLNSFLNFHLGKELKSQRAINKLDSAGAFS